ncbi:YggS family pyridoxal phosphate-dependent enzyme [Pseudoalteromonas ulvae]|uniref:YggS family pyridoxal phosphate-dependent enzyme n=1 Tax=Pseudoalteromonas ulvae TaxID=107327 RepID=UPI00186B7FB1|nr:YggS family pyridoxal phosphate-dependent enzyme [Pseudoalteromonas ulvae]
MTPQLSDNYMVTIAERLKSAYARIALAEKKAQKPAQSVSLLAVSKTKPVQLIIDAYEAGHRKFGESYVQEAVDKIKQLPHRDIEWHFIGPIQSNKTKPIAENFSWVQSVERIKIADRLNKQRPNNLLPLNVLIQVNISNDAAKSGCPVEEVSELAEFIAQSRQLTLRGLMTIPAQTDNEAELIASFSQLRACFDTLKTQYPSMDTLSMGMSGDVEAAITAGSTMVRIGTDIFGARDYPTQQH